MMSMRTVLVCVAVAMMALLSLDASAVPSFARQTGMDCTTCHMSWLELTNVGRRFKLGGYQLTKHMDDGAERPLISFNFKDNAPVLPIAGMLQLSSTHTANTSTAGTDKASDFPLNNELIIQQASIFYNGKIVDHVGCFCQFTYDGAAAHFAIDNFEVRVADSARAGGFDALYGVSLNNSPTMSDIWNTTPVWGWPYVGSTVAPAPAASPMINGALAQQVAGLTAYALVNKTLYVEGGAYRKSNGVLSFLHLNVPGSESYTLEGAAPYFRVALQHEWDGGHQSAMVGAFGLDAKVYQPGAPASGATDRYRDTGFDSQYQYITDKHRVSAMVTYIHERQTLDGLYENEQASNRDNTLNFLNAKVSYYYNKWYGISVGYQKTNGTADAGLYDNGAAVVGSVNGKPDSEALITELNYLMSPSNSQSFRRARLVLQYTAYSKFNGGTTNYDGFGRDAKDNNTLYLLAWLMY
jgi:hypothetical protein